MTLSPWWTLFCAGISNAVLLKIRARLPHGDLRRITPRDWGAYGVSAESVRWLADFFDGQSNLLSQRLQQITAWAAAPQHHLLDIAASDYPPLLQQIVNPPVVLFAQGNLHCALLPQIAIVGARQATPSGLRNAQDFARALSTAGFVITSGLALGTDAAAHRGTLEVQGRTCAVLGCGLSRIYPARNRALAEAIIENGLLLSEFPLNSAPLRGHFPQRNRIISGVSLGTLVIEASERSGSLITARLAAEQNREVFALPGAVHNPYARGCHRLIRNGATLVDDPAQIVDALQHALNSQYVLLKNRLPTSGVSTTLTSNASTTHTTAWHDAQADTQRQRVLAQLGFELTPIDVLSTATGIDIPQLHGLLLELELDGQVAQQGGAFQRVQ